MLHLPEALVNRATAPSCTTGLLFSPRTPYACLMRGAAADQRAGTGRHGPWLALIIIAAGYFLNVLDSTVVNVAVPSIVSSLHTTADQILWVLNGYLFPYAILLPLAGRLGDFFGHRNVLFVGLFVFTLASLVSGFAGSGSMLIFGRALQGVGAAAAAPQAIAITSRIFPAERKGVAFGALAAVTGVAAAAGPVIGGLVTQTLGWRWIFLLNIPVSLVSLVGVFLFVPLTREGVRVRLGLLTVVVGSVGLFALLYGLIEGQRYRWGSVVGVLTVPHILILAVLLLAGLLLWERAQHGVLLPNALFTSRNYAFMVCAGVGLSFGIFASQLVMTIYLQSGEGASALQVGLVLSPMWVAASLISPIGGRAAARMGARPVLVTAFSLFAGGIALTALFAQLAYSWPMFIAPLMMAGLGAGLSFGPLPLVAMEEVEPHAAGGASALIETGRQIGGALGVCAVGIIIQTAWSSSLRHGAPGIAAQFPPGERERFINGALSAADRGFDPARGGPSLPDLPSGMNEALHHLSAAGLATGTGIVLYVTACVLLAAVFVCLAIRNNPHAT